MRATIWATITAAFALSILSMEACDLINGFVVNHDAVHILSEDGGSALEDEALGVLEDSGLGDLEEYVVGALDGQESVEDLIENPDLPKRSVPDTYDSFTFSLGVFKAWDPAVGRCVDYKNSYSELFMSYGGAEKAAKLFGSLASFLGGISMICFIAFAAGRVTNKYLLIIFSVVLYTAALFQSFIFSVMKSDHCSNSYWNDFLPLISQKEELFSVQCEMGTGGWYALAAVALYFTSGVLVNLKWSKPKVALVELTIEEYDEVDDDAECPESSRTKNEETKRILDGKKSSTEIPQEQATSKNFQDEHHRSSETEPAGDDEHLLSHVSNTLGLQRDEDSEVTGIAGAKNDGPSMARTEV